MKRLTALLLLVFTLPVLNGCATLFTGSEDVVTFESSPAGAEILINGIEKGTTPVSIPVKRSVNSAEVVLRLAGYETRVFRLEQEFNYVSLLNLFNVLFWGIDVVSGAVMTYRPTYYEFNLKPKGLVEHTEHEDDGEMRMYSLKDLSVDEAGRYTLPNMGRGQNAIVVEDVFPDRTLVITRAR